MDGWNTNYFPIGEASAYFSGVNSLLVFREEILLDLPPPTQDASSKEKV